MDIADEQAEHMLDPYKAIAEETVAPTSASVTPKEPTKPKSQWSYGYMGIPYTEGSADVPLVSVPPSVPTTALKVMSKLPIPSLATFLNLVPKDQRKDVIEGLGESIASQSSALTSQKGLATAVLAGLQPEIGIPAFVAYGEKSLYDALEESKKAETPKEKAIAAGNIAGAAGMILAPVAHGAISGIESGMAARSKAATQAAAQERLSVDLAARNLAAPGTMRPQERQMFAPPSPEAPPEMVTGELPPKYSQTPIQPPFFMEPPAGAPEVPLAPKIQRETRGKVSFGAEAPTLLRESIAPRDDKLPPEPSSPPRHRSYHT